MKLDIVIPVLNEAERLPKLLNHLSSYTNVKVNTFVVDASESNDNTAQICQKFDVMYLKSKATRRSIQMNEGARLAKGDTLLFLHADVLPPNQFDQLIAQAIEQGAEAGCFSYHFDSNHLLLKINAFFTKFKGIFAGGGDQCLFIKKSIFNQLNGFDDTKSFMEDFEFYDRLKKAKIVYKIIDCPAIVSARKYERNSYFRVNLANLITFIKYKCGHRCESLKRSYVSWLD